jgi:hypothetical protein
MQSIIGPTRTYQGGNFNVFENRPFRCRVAVVERVSFLFGKELFCQSRASKAPVEIHETLAALLQAWRQETPYRKESDFVFPSFKLHGKQPRLGSMIVEDYIRPAGRGCRTNRGGLPEVRVSQI